VKKGVEKSEIEAEGAGASRLDTETGLAPMSSLGVVPECAVSNLLLYVRLVRCASSMFRRRIDGGGVDFCVPDGVAGPQADPLGNGTVLLLRARKLLLGAERLVGLHIVRMIRSTISWWHQVDSYRHRDCCVGCRMCCRWSRGEY
jgi:hypothetical protein